MPFHKIPIFQSLVSKIRWDTKRQEILTRNLARADLPGAQAKDLKPFRLPNSTKTTNPSLAKTNARHIGVSSSNTGGFKVETDKTELDVTLAGNHINPENQMRKMNETSTDHAKMVSLYKNSSKLLKTILRGR